MSKILLTIFSLYFYEKQITLSYPKPEQLRLECYLAQIDQLNVSVLRTVEVEATRIYQLIYTDFIQKHEMELSKLVTPENLTKSFSSITTTNAIVQNWIQLNWSYDLKNQLYDFILENAKLEKYNEKFLFPAKNIKGQTKYLVYQDINTIDQVDSYLCIYMLGLIGNTTNLLEKTFQSQAQSPQKQNVQINQQSVQQTIQNQQINQQNINDTKQQQIIDNLSSKLYQSKQEQQSQMQYIQKLEEEVQKLQNVNQRLLQQSTIQSEQLKNYENNAYYKSTSIDQQISNRFEEQRKAFEFQINQLNNQLTTATLKLKQCQDENKILQSQIQQHNVDASINRTNQSYHQYNPSNKYEQLIQQKSQISYPLSMTMPPINSVQSNDEKDYLIQNLRTLVNQLQNKNNENQTQIVQLQQQIQDLSSVQASQRQQQSNQDTYRQMQTQIIQLQEQLNTTNVNYKQKFIQQQQIIDQQSQQAKELKEQIVNQNIKIKQLREKIQQSSSDFQNEVYARTIEDLQNHIIRLNKEARDMNIINQNVMLERDKMENQLIDLKMQQGEYVGNMRAQNVALKQMNQSLLDELKTYSKKQTQQPQISRQNSQVKKNETQQQNTIQKKVEVQKQPQQIQQPQQQPIQEQQPDQQPEQQPQQPQQSQQSQQTQEQQSQQQNDDKSLNQSDLQ